MARKNELTRRTFLRRAGLLVSSLGVSGAVYEGMMDRIVKRASKRWGSEAIAAGTSTPTHFVVELNLRAGFQFNSLFPSAGHRTPVTNRVSGLNFYNSESNVLSFTSPVAGSQPVYYAKYGTDGVAKMMQNASIQNGKIGIATSETINLFDGNHTANFYTRSPNSSAPCASVLHDALCRQDTLLSNTPGGTISYRSISQLYGVVNAVGDPSQYQAPQDVDDSASFLAALTPAPMFFSEQELELVAGVVRNGAVQTPGAVDTLDAAFKTKHPGALGFDKAIAVSTKGRGLAELTLGQAVATMAQQLRTQYFVDGVDDGEPMSAGGQTYALNGSKKLGDILAHTAAGFANQAMTTCTIALESNDWHSDIPALDQVNSKQGSWNKYIGNALAGFLASCEQIDDPYAPGTGKKLIDSLLIVVNSEFTRTPTLLGGSDNGDGGTGALCLIGSGVKSGSLGDIDGTNGAIHGFDPVSGATLGNAGSISEAMVWKTIGKLCGASDVLLNSIVPDSQAKVISTILR